MEASPRGSRQTPAAEFGGSSAWMSSSISLVLGTCQTERGRFRRDFFLLEQFISVILACGGSVELQFARNTFLMVDWANPWRWECIVQHYSAANLTYKPDRLPALSGVAALQHKATGDQYLAGLWKTSLVYHLVWQVQDGQYKPRPEWRAPTWSWASVDTKTFYRTPHIGWSQTENREKFINREYVRVLAAKTVPSSLDPFGSVESGGSP